MSLFAEALREGFNAARNAEIAKKEIDSVFDELNDEVAKETGNRVYIERVASFFERLPVSLNDKKHVQKKGESPSEGAIVVVDRLSKTTRRLEIAEFSMDSAGYPFRISWDKQTYFCEDKVALVNWLADLLRDPTVGRMLGQLVRGVQKTLNLIP